MFNRLWLYFKAIQQKFKKADWDNPWRECHMWNQRRSKEKKKNRKCFHHFLKKSSFPYFFFNFQLKMLCLLWFIIFLSNQITRIKVTNTFLKQLRFFSRVMPCTLRLMAASSLFKSRPTLYPRSPGGLCKKLLRVCGYHVSCAFAWAHCTSLFV